MFVIRKQQMQAFETQFVLPVYERKMRAYLRSMHPGVSESYDDEALGSLIHTLRLQATRYGAADAVAWSQFTDLWLAFGPGFDLAPAASSILLDYRTTWPAKCALLTRQLHAMNREG
jgi:hypothetical protein